MNIIKRELSNIIDNVILKRHSFDQKNSFYDDFEEILFKNRIKDEKYFLILNLIDFYEDAINHNFKELDSDYSVNQAKKDLLFLSAIMREDNELKIPNDLYKRLYNLSLYI